MLHKLYFVFRGKYRNKAFMNKWPIYWEPLTVQSIHNLRNTSVWK